jgi:amino acid transporter
VFLVTILCHALLATTLQRIMHRLQTVSVVMNLILIAATMIALPVGKHLASERNDAKYIFTQSANLTTWPTGWAFMLAWMSPIWTIGDFDSCVHISEEVSFSLPTYEAIF